MLPSLFAHLPRIVLVLFALSVTFFPAHAAQFTADLTITSPQDSFVYDLKVKDNNQVVTFENVNIINGQSQTVTADFPITK